MATFDIITSDHLVTLQIIKGNECLQLSRPVDHFTMDVIVKDTIDLIDRFFNLDFYTSNSFNLMLNPIFLKPIILVQEWYNEAEALESSERSCEVEFRNQKFNFFIYDKVKCY